MAEKYFEVTKESDLYKEYDTYENSLELNKEKIKDFCKKSNINGEYGYLDSIFFLKNPTKEEKEQFKGQLCLKSDSDGYIPFKKNSKIGKAWTSKDFKILHRPFVGFYFQDCCGHTSSRIFKIGDKIYCSFKNEYDTMETPEGFIEMKASEFFKIIEDNEAINNE